MSETINLLTEIPKVYNNLYLTLDNYTYFIFRV